MNKYRLTISVVKGDTLLTDIYVVECPTMAIALGKAARYSEFQLEEEGAEYVKHISVTLHKEAEA